VAARTVTIRTEDGAVVCDRCEVARGPIHRMRGLLGRASLPPGQGLLMPHTPSVHMFFMRFPIDVVFLDREQRITRIAHDLRPWRIASGGRGAKSALELSAGAAAEAALAPGAKLVVTDDGTT
jgi:uncharacterized membrane protein (UPF0127 family)